MVESKSFKSILKHYDPQLGEEVDTLEYCDYGICPLCSEPNRQPKRFGLVYFCHDCIKTRMEDCQKVVKAFSKLQNDNKSDETFK